MQTPAGLRIRRSRNRERTGLLQLAVAAVGVGERETAVVVRVADGRDEVRRERERAVVDQAHAEDADGGLDVVDVAEVRRRRRVNALGVVVPSSRMYTVLLGDPTRG